MPKETKNIETILNSLEGMERAEANPFLYNKIEQRIKVPFTKGKMIPLRSVYMAAASIVLLVAINIVMLSGDKEQKTAGNNMHEVAAEYGLTDNMMGGL